MNQPTIRGRRGRKLTTVWITGVASAAALALGSAVAGAAEDLASAPAIGKAQTNRMNVAIKIGTKTFTATLEDDALAKAFKALLPATVRMTELNGNEKYFRFSGDLPTNASNPKTIQTGDLMIYGRNTLVLFYKSFPTPYTYTRLGHIDDARGLEAALGAGSVDVTFRSR